MEPALEQSELRSASAAEARALLKEQQSGKKSIAAFARDRGIRPWSLYNVQATDRRRKKRRAKRCFVPVTVTEKAKAQAPGGMTGIELSLPSGLSLQLEAGFDEVALRRLLGILFPPEYTARASLPKTLSAGSRARSGGLSSTVA